MDTSTHFKWCGRPSFSMKSDSHSSSRSSQILASILYGNNEGLGIPKLASYRIINEITTIKCTSTPCTSIGEYGCGPFLQTICINEVPVVTPKSHAQQLFQQETVVVWENYLREDCVELQEVIVTRANGRCEASLDGKSYRFQLFETQDLLIAGQYEKQHWCHQDSTTTQTSVTLKEWTQRGENKNKCLGGKHKLEIV